MTEALTLKYLTFSPRFIWSSKSRHTPSRRTLLSSLAQSCCSLISICSSQTERFVSTTSRGLRPNMEQKASLTTMMF